MTAPIVDIVAQAQREYLANFGFPAEKLHASLMFEGALQRWATANAAYPADPIERLQGATFNGLEVVRMTRRSALVEFWLTAERDGQIYAQQVRVEPEAVGIRQAVNTNGIVLGDESPDVDIEAQDIISDAANYDGTGYGG